MREIGIQSRVPEQRHRELRRGDRKGKTMHPGAQNSRMSFRNGGDQVGGSGQSECRREPIDNRHDLPC